MNNTSNEPPTDTGNGEGGSDRNESQEEGNIRLAEEEVNNPSDGDGFIDDGENEYDNSENVTESTFNGLFKIAFVDKRITIIRGNKQAESLDSSKSNEEVVKLTIYNENSEEQASVSLSGNTTGNSVSLGNLMNYELKENDYIAIENTSSEFAKNAIKITGRVLKQKENYEDGIDTKDNIDNVRFKLTEYGLECVYNEAPAIEFTDTKFEAMLGDELDYLKYANLSDDHDELDISNVKVVLLNNTPSENTEPDNSEGGSTEEEANLKTNLQDIDNNFNDTDDTNSNIADPEKGWKIGENRVKYLVTDLWGRKTEKERIINLTNALPNIEIQFMGHTNQNNEDDAKVALNMFFDTTDMKIKFKDKQDMYFRYNNKENIEYRVTLIKSESTREVEIVGEAKGKEKANNSDLNLVQRLNEQTFKYGDKIKFYAWHQDLLRIQGPVRNGIEDYSNGVQLGDGYSNVVFEITEAGLKSTYTPDSSYEGELKNSIIPSAREGFPFVITIDSRARNINAHSGKPYSIEYGTDEKSLEIILYGANGVAKRTLSMNGYESGITSKTNSLNGSFEYGDYLTIYHRTPKNISIRGKVIDSEKLEDYSDGIDDEDNMKNVIFQLTPEGIKAIYKEPPRIEGADDDLILIKGENIPEDSVLLKGVTALDSLGQSLPVNISNKTIDISQIGLYDITYSATDSESVTGTYNRTVIVRAKPVITRNEEKYAIEEGSINNNDIDIIKERLKEAVIVTDEEDDVAKIPVKLEVVDPKIDFNKAGVYNITYKATDSHGNETISTIEIEVKRTISVTVPTVVPFQVVTNLIDKSDDPFVSGILKIQNNNTTPVEISLKSFEKKDANDEGIELVNPANLNDENYWNNLTSEESMKKIALGIYPKLEITPDISEDTDDSENQREENNVGNVEASDGTTEPKREITKENPIWLVPGEISEQKIGTISRATSIGNPSEMKLGFTSKHGKNFIGGKVKSKFKLMFKFE